MTDADYILELATRFRPQEIARKMEMRLLDVLAVIRTGAGARQTMSAEQIAQHFGGSEFTAPDLATMLQVEISAAREQLKVMEKKGRARRIGERACKGGQTVIWIIEASK